MSGKRVGAILSATKDTIKFLGWGTYVGDEVPPEEIGGLNLGLPNPKIELDSGDVVWGCECWWGSEHQVQKYLDGREVINVDIKEVRKQHED